MLFCDGNLSSLTFAMEVAMRIFLIAAVVLSFAFAGLYSSSQAGETKAKTEEMKGEVKADAERTKGEAKGLKEDIKGNDVDRKSTRLNSSLVAISYAVFCLK